ncbi:DUF3046 domain-containing protein [Arsenicicoccus sp. oral taxon 190]|uniref:DUF3046 domain-containing protein n=1 Tax=Arsenicicoccus sp. oral taxon 190 TaxID=1658671 RepID=UPI00067A116E|nr:DUF3046 domain-containing protein [Arsenicicoccus sp. oral taxon 190]AKT52198.1 histidine kinase [Arsenicicoccus sp. oral taxon 190]
MRVSELKRLLDDEFGASYASSVAADHQMGALGGRTVDQAVAAGIDPRTIWLALCDSYDIPPERRLGKDRPLRRDAPLD